MCVARGCFDDCTVGVAVHYINSGDRHCIFDGFKVADRREVAAVVIGDVTVPCGQLLCT